MNTYFIAEIGSNHNHDLERAKQLITSASDYGFNAVKFQTFKADKLYADIPMNAKKIEISKKWELPREWLSELYQFAKLQGLDIGISVFDFDIFNEKIIDSFDFLKIGSYEILRLNLIERCCQSEVKKIMFSTGMASKNEIDNAYNIIEKYRYDKDIILFHCCSKYPAPLNNLNLNLITTYKQNYPCHIGYSDHSVNEGAIYKAIQLRANCIEMHLDLEDLKGWESEIGHCWHSKLAYKVIKNVRDGKIADKFTPIDTYLRLHRADPKDGLRPLKIKRQND